MKNGQLDMSKILGFKMTCKACDQKWIQQRDDNWNVHCIQCGDKQTQKEMVTVWCEVTEVKDLAEYED